MRRDRATWVAYAGQSMFGFSLYGSGVITGLVREELTLGYLASAVLPVLFTAGAVLGATLSGWLLRGEPAAGRELRIIGGAAIGMGMGMALVAIPSLTTAGAGLGVAGLAGGTVPPAGAWLLARRHGEQAGRALLEANVLGALAGVVAAGALSGAGALGVWRLALGLPVVFGSGLLVWSLATARQARAAVAPRESVGAAGDGSSAPLRRRLPAPARWYLLVAVAGGVLEFGVIYWAADLLAQRAGMGLDRASGALVAFTGGLVVGRAAMSLVAGSLRASRRVLLGSLGVAVVGAGGLLVAAAPWQGVVALGVVGIGTAALYPVSLALAVAAAGRAGGRASSLLSVCVGVAALAAPVLLAAGAEALSMQVAFLAVPLAGLAGLAAALQARRGPERPAETRPRGQTRARRAM